MAIPQERPIDQSMTRFRRKPSRKAVHDTIAGYAFVAPALFGFCMFTFFPVVASLLIGFFRWDLLTSPAWIGLENYTTLFHDEVFLISLKNTLLWVIYIADGAEAKRVRRLAWVRSRVRSRASRRLLSKWKRSAT
jgi:hypothetical protein